MMVEDIYFVDDESSVRLECFGSGNLEWSSSIDSEITTSVLENVYQSYDHTRDALALVIRNFTNITTAMYTCMTDLNDTHNRPITISILITSCKQRERERERERWGKEVV